MHRSLITIRRQVDVLLSDNLAFIHQHYSQNIKTQGGKGKWTSLLLHPSCISGGYSALTNLPSISIHHVASANPPYKTKSRAREKRSQAATNAA